MSENLEYYQNQIISARTEIRNLRQKLSALKHQHSKDIKTIKAMLVAPRCATCTTEPATRYMPIPQRRDTPSPTEDILYTPIGYIETSFENKRAVPRQPTVLYSAKGVVIINTDFLNNPEHALIGLEEFSHMWIIFHFHSTSSRSVSAKISPPRLAGEKRGVFSTRSPHRPCPIGLSLVKIHSIEGNKITFHGVDMINNTPVLDIKPYIPQYDYPIQTFDSISSNRPPTEGTSDALELNNLQLNVPDINSINSQIQNPIGIETNSLDSPLDEEIPSPVQNISAAVSPPIQRGDPDGQERFTPPQRIMNLSDGIRVPNWITNPPSQRYKVIFTEEALDRLSTLIGDRAGNFKINIEQLLSEDPRSLYVRTRYPDHEYSCVLEDVSISCEFDSGTSVCTIVAMFLTRSEYDRGVNTFSPEGRLFQVEYAIEAIKLGSTAIGICTSEGVVLAVEKRITSPLMEPTTIEKIVEVDRHIACAVSGLMADSRTLIERARVECQNHWFVYNERMSVESCAQAVSNLAIQFGDSDDDSGTAMSRPFGVAVMFAGIDEKGPQLFHMDPSGTFVQYDAKAIGSGSEGAQQSLKEVYHKSMTLKEAIKSALTILKQVMEEKLSETNVEVVTMTPGSMFHMFTREQLAEVIKDIP